MSLHDINQHFVRVALEQNRNLKQYLEREIKIHQVFVPGVRNMEDARIGIMENNRFILDNADMEEYASSKESFDKAKKALENDEFFVLS